VTARAHDLLTLAASKMEQTIGVIDLETWAFAYLSPRFEAVWGRPRDALMSDSRRFLDWVHPEDHPRMLAQLGRSVDGPTEVEFRILRGDGSVRWLRSYAVTLADPPDGPRRLLGVTEDVTDRRQIVDALRARIADLESDLDATRARVAELEGRPEAGPITYTVTCRTCASVVAATPRIGDAEATVLREHLQRSHGEVFPAGHELSMDALLAEYRVERRRRGSAPT
jgi:PAS domain S-box-containing protein